ncbi:cupin-like domain-containing protein [Pseudomonas sp. PDM24]|jgi:hypothetical protein|uniref:cupin-like domain-containing protein n=1 Tax=Pseudomonas TaxID=286 RepID=UPI001C493673|nr:cupin-like domain-containing protein [Pseudomonas sp. PDM24]MBV7496930.1 cupin-like domain-containing protein [Pseudomonas sp. PDM24]
MPLQAALSELFIHAKAAGIAGIFQFIFSEQQSFWICAPTSTIARPGVHPGAVVTISLEASVFLAIMRGAADIEELFSQGQLSISGNIGRATLLPSLISAARFSGGKAVHVEMDRRYLARPRFSEQLSMRVDMNGEIERRPKCQVSVEEFNTHYRANGIPLLLTEALTDWPLFNMSRPAVIEHLGNVQGITRHGDYAKKAFSSERDFRATCLIDFIATLDTAGHQGSCEPSTYMGNNRAPEQLLQLIRFPDYFKRSLYLPPRFWLGPKGTLTPLHRDDSDNFFAQVWGEKAILLAAPHHREALGSWSTSPQGGLEGCDFNPSSPDFDRFPKARQVKFFHLQLRPGDMLYLPEGWYHEVSSLSLSLSINFWVNAVRSETYALLGD